MQAAAMAKGACPIYMYFCISVAFILGITWNKKNRMFPTVPCEYISICVCVGGGGVFRNPSVVFLSLYVTCG